MAESTKTELGARITRARIIKWDPGFAPALPELERPDKNPHCVEIVEIADNGEQLVVYRRPQYE